MANEINLMDLGLIPEEEQGGSEPQNDVQTNADEQDIPETSQEEQQQDVENSDDAGVKTDDETQDEDPYEVIANILKQEGIISLPDDTKVTSDNFRDVIGGYIEEKANSAVMQLMSSLPQEVQYLVQYSLNGGDVKEVLPLLQQGKNVVPEVNESNAELVVRNYMKQKGLDDDVIDMTVKSLQDSGKLIDAAKKYNDEYKAMLEQQEKQRLAELEQQRKEQEAKIAEFVEHTVKVSEQMGLPKEQVYQFLTVPVEEVNGTPVTMLEQKMQKMYSDPDVFAKFVYWAMNDFSDDIFVKKAKAQVSKDVMKKLSNIVKTPKQGQDREDNRPLWEVFK